MRFPETRIAFANLRFQFWRLIETISNTRKQRAFCDLCILEVKRDNSQ